MVRTEYWTRWACSPIQQGSYDVLNHTFSSLSDTLICRLELGLLPCNTHGILNKCWASPPPAIERTAVSFASQSSLIISESVSTYYPWLMLGKHFFPATEPGKYSHFACYYKKIEPPFILGRGLHPFPQRATLWCHNLQRKREVPDWKCVWNFTSALLRM